MKAEINQEEQVAVCKSTKRKDPFFITKVGKHHFFEVTVQRGKVPACLEGKFSSLENGVKAIHQWEKQASETKAAHRDAFLEARRKQKDAEKD